MDTNGNQRKRAGRMGKNPNANEKLLPQNVVHNESMEVSGAAISPTIEESENVPSPPAAECRRSSRKKIIKFDVRDLLNKNRKTHKIQIEARIDSNAPTTSKAAVTGGIETTNSKATLTTMEDLLSKQKTFLEKSAIFRRYSISQEQKPPPPPLPLPPILGQSNESKDISLSCSTNSRRLSRTQEFFSNVLIKPKQTTSLIVAQIESNAPCSVATMKRKNICKSVESKVVEKPEVEHNPVVQQKKRGRPAKIKVLDSVKTSPLEETTKKKISPEKAKNWKEYKACIAHQTDNRNEEESSFKGNEVKTVHDTMNTDVSKSDEDGNFSGFQTNKDDISCGSPVLSNISLEKNLCIKESVASHICNETKIVEKQTIEISEAVEPIDTDSNILEEVIKKDVNLDNAQQDIQDEKERRLSTYSSAGTSELKEVTNREDIRETEVQVVSKLYDHIEKILFKNSQVCLDLQQSKEIEIKSDGNSGISRSSKKENNATSHLSDETCKQNEITSSSTPIKFILNKAESEKIGNFESNVSHKLKTTVQKKIVQHENQLEVKESFLPKCTETIKECSYRENKVICHDIHSRNEMEEIPQPSTSSKQIKFLSRTSSSSESENSSEHSSYSSEPFSTTSSSSRRSYKSGDKLKISIKRISLPKSPSTSSQTSTSEELNNFNVQNRKPAMGKRSKRMQKKFLQSLEKTDVTANTVFFESIPSASDNVAQNVDAQTNIENLPLLLTGVKAVAYENVESTTEENINQIQSTGLVTKDSEQQLKQDDPVQIKASETLESLSNKISNDSNLSASKKIEKTKSFRNRKHSTSCENDNEINEQNYEIRQTPQEYEIKVDLTKQDSLIIDELDQHNFKHTSESNHGDNSDEKEISTKTQSPKPDIAKGQSLVAKEISGILLSTDKETVIQSNIITSDNILKLSNVENKDIEVTKISNENEIGMIRETCESASLELEKNIETIESENISNKDVNSINKPKKPVDSNLEIKIPIPNEFSEDMSIQHNQVDEEKLDSIEKPKSTSRKSTKIKSGNVTKRKSNKNVATVNDSKSQNEKLIETDICSFKNKNQQNKDLKFQGNTDKETQSSKMKFSSCEQWTPEVIPAVIAASTEDKCNSTFFEKSTEERTGEATKSERASYSQVSKKQEKSRKVQGKGKNIKEFSTTANREALISEVNLDSTVEKTRSSKKIASKEDRTTKSRSNREVVAIKKRSNQVRHPTEMSSKSADEFEDSKEHKEFFETDSEMMNATKTSPICVKLGKEENLTPGKFKEKLIKASFEEEKPQSITKACKEIETSQCNRFIPTADHNLPTVNKELGNFIVSAGEETAPAITFESDKFKNHANVSAIFASSSESLKTAENLTNKQTFATEEHNSSEKVCLMDSPSTSSNNIIHFKDAKSPVLTINTGDDEWQETEETLTFSTEAPSAEQENILKKDNQQILVTKPAVFKRRGRKSRFKNLYDSEHDSGTDNSTRNTLEHEITSQKLNVQTEATDRKQADDKEIPSSEISIDSHTTEVNVREEHENFQEKSDTNLLSSQIKNVSIETNTLLDILRTVQSNTEAALKAGKSPFDIEVTNNDNSIGSTTEKGDEESKDIINIEQEAETTSPPRFETESPATVIKSNLSPERSDAGSPLTSKKITPSPTRSNSSSPLTLKKVTRRYERRNRRGEDTAHKTLEETFAEIAAQSSKAVLAAKEYNLSEEQLINEKEEKESDDINTEKKNEKDEMKEHCAEFQSPTTDEVQSQSDDEFSHKALEEPVTETAPKSSEAIQVIKEYNVIQVRKTDGKSQKESESVLNVAEEQFTENFINVEKLATDEISEDCDQTAVEKCKPIFTLGDCMESVNETINDQNDNIDLTETTLTSKEQEVKVNFEELQKSATDVEDMPAEILLTALPSKESISNSAENVVEIDTANVTPVKRGRKPKNRSLEATITVVKEAPPAKNCSTTSKDVLNEIIIEKETTEINNDYKKNEYKINESPENIQAKKNSLPDLLPEISVKDSMKAHEDVSESSSSKKSSKKHDTKAVIEQNISIENVSTIIEKLAAPKQFTKKRDSSQGKTEGKSVSKKLSKKTKVEESNSLNLVKDENLVKVATSTAPTPKRGRKPKSQQIDTSPYTTSSKKKNKKDTCIKNEEEINVEMTKLLESESESLKNSLDKALDDNLAKKKRQKKLKEDFEAALAEDIGKCKEAPELENPNTSTNTSLELTTINNSQQVEPNQSVSIKQETDAIRLISSTPAEAEDDPDPLKDIEKFIADGVNLLKKDYKLDEDSVDDVIQNVPSKTTDVVEEANVKAKGEEIKTFFNIYETPADTPLNTPSVTPPPKSPTSIESSTPDENSGVRRSHRIKLITKTPKALVGRGLVRDKERFSIKDAVETKTHYTLDDHLTDLAEVEAKNAEFLKEMEERLSNFQVIKDNEYLCERVISKEARKMICDCFLTHEEEERGELGCGEDCLNRLLMIECGPDCNVKERCTNKRFQKLLCSPCRVFRTEKKGFGIMADIEILPGEFIMEYVGEVIDTEEFEKRRITYSQDKNRHYYFMALRSDAIIDATIKGNISRFINHSCDPNAETQKWTVNGELRIGFFSRKSIMPGEEITFNYQYQRYGREAQRCYCESTNCRGWIGQEPTSDEGEQVDDEDDESEDDEEGEEADTSNLLVQDDDEDSDASVADPEEVQKKLEMAAAQAEAELAPLQLLAEKTKHGEINEDDSKAMNDLNKSDNEEDSKSKFKKLLSKMAEKVAAKQKQNKRAQKLQRKQKSKKSSAELANKLRFLEDPDIEDEVGFLKECGLKNQSDTLRLSRLMVRAKLVQTRLNLLEILRKGDLPCRRLFLDYHGLRLLHGWMSEDAGNMQIRLSLLRTLDTLPIANKTVLTDSKVMQVVRIWCGNNANLSPSDDSSSSNSNSQDVLVQGATNIEDGSEIAELQKLALKLIATWEGLPEIFRIPKKERIEQMKEHEREADRQYAANAETHENTTATDRYRRNRFGRGLNTFTNAPSTSNRFVKPNSGSVHRVMNAAPENRKNLSKAQRREMFAAKVARDEAEKRLAEERREFETKCRFFGLDHKKTRAQDIPFCVNPATGQWYSIERKPITTPPSYAHVQVPVKPKSTDPNDYQLPAVCSTLPHQWKYAITPQGKIYYYHIKHRIPQWEPPSAAQLQKCDLEDREEDSETELTTTAGEDSSDDDDDILIGMDVAQLKAYIDRKVEMRRQKRYQRLVDERSISPRREEDRIYNQLEVRKYKENKEKIRKRKEDIRRKRAEVLRQTSLNMCTLGSITDTNPNTNKLNTESDEESGALPIQDYLLSSDEEVDLKAEVNSPLIDKIVEGDKIVDELDALTTKRQLKRPLPPHRDLNEPSTSASPLSSSISSTHVAKSDHKKRKLERKERRKPKEQDAKYRKNKEKFRCEIAGIIVHHLKPYLKDTCNVGRIQTNDDFNHLARKLTHFVMIKELKYCESVGQTLVVTESVKSKSREFIKKYMTKYGDVYVKPSNDPDFKDIPFTL